MSFNFRFNGEISHRNPCKQDCPDRKGGCHATCETYRAFEAWKTEKYENRKKYYSVHGWSAKAVARSREIPQPHGATENTTSEVLKMDDVIEVVCPTCGCDEASTFYRHGNEIVGCEYCLTRLERYEVAEILEEERYERDYWRED